VDKSPKGGIISTLLRESRRYRGNHSIVPPPHCPD
jgi:hypothetical protein